VEETMRLTATLDLARRPLSTLSGGEMRRVMICRAIAQEPELMVLDEPTSHLDINHTLEMMDLLVELGEQKGITLVVVLHDLNLASWYCCRLVILKDGKVLAQSPSEEVITREMVELTYGVETEVAFIGGKPVVVPRSRKAQDGKERTGNQQQRR